MFSTDACKGSYNYLKSQKFYEAARTFIYFAISFALFIAGYFTTGTRLNLLTIVAVLGCLPACRSAVSMIMFMRCRGCSVENAGAICKSRGELDELYDMVFTSYDRNYVIAHLAVKGNTICGFTEDVKLDEQAFYRHIDAILKTDGFRDASIKIYKDIKKYEERLKQMNELDADDANTKGIINTLKSVAL
ncbi:MAG: hypothetical protein LUG83_05895 [Lachnospiraceae bacterium]|nr:hypothetical protein [Lachnospiraceae bacterium]